MIFVLKPVALGLVRGQIDAMRVIAALVILLAAPALAAEPTGLSISGDARMGVTNDRSPEWAGTRESGLRLTTRNRIRLRFVGETDGGLRFGGQIELENEDGRARNRQIFVDR